jgi:hypothetical protein
MAGVSIFKWGRARRPSALENQNPILLKPGGQAVSSSIVQFESLLGWSSILL